MNQTHAASGATLALPSPRANRPYRAGPTPGLLERAVEIFSRWRERSRSRDELARLDGHQLRDIGLTRSQALSESRKFFMQP